MRHSITLGRQEGRIRKRAAKATCVDAPLFTKEGVGGVRGLNLPERTKVKYLEAQ